MKILEESINQPERVFETVMTLEEDNFKDDNIFLRNILTDYNKPINEHIASVILQSKSFTVKSSNFIKNMFVKSLYKKNMKAINEAIRIAINNSNFEVIKLLIDETDAEMDHVHLCHLSNNHKAKELIEYYLHERNIPFIPNTKYEIKTPHNSSGNYTHTTFKFDENGKLSFGSEYVIDM